MKTPIERIIEAGQVNQQTLIEVKELREEVARLQRSARRAILISQEMVVIPRKEVK